ncbi:tRNA (adenosine(37)-N6)-threonylcarbamoyltransferase complex dimerization subunit type 1 TsaB [Furfurilactobacillus entadae]|uniref:tRNA (adenosine(37)-N6)-threonylcarbamoyltransferase complex dimerization subunit type 1 TsaB n=1 Tax=Furfurilactobacillus entadae TaxID=2922307 RepID=UPI0035E8E181
MKVLALDTSNRPLSVALLEDETVVGKVTTATQLDHSVQLMSAIASLMADEGWQPTDLDRVVVAQGPGSYTGVRIAVTTAKTLAATLNLELVGVSSLAVLAGGVAQASNQLIVPVFDGRNTQLYAGGYRVKEGELTNVIADQHTNLTSWLTLLADLNEPVLLVGETTRYHDEIVNQLGDNALFAPTADNLPDAGVLGQLGQAIAPVENIDNFVPKYLRLSPAEAQWAAAHPGETNTNYVEEV